MVNRPRQIGTSAETSVVRWLADHGWPYAERRSLRGRQDAGDVTGTPLVAWEVKAGEAAYRASDAQVADWLADTDRERINAAADVGVLVLRRRGKGSPGDWWAYVPAHVLAYLALGFRGAPFSMPTRLTLADLTHLLRVRGYGDPLTTTTTQE